MKKLFWVVVSCLMQLTHLNAQERRTDFALNYTTEWQTDFRQSGNWVNLLRADFSVDILRGRKSGGLSLEIATISVAQTRTESIIEDLQGFSNIEAEDIPLIPAVFSLAWKTEHTTLQFGVRNINENYFISDHTSFYTHSSNGIFPTIACNFPIANYPYASLGIDFEWHTKGWGVNTSLYNGLGYNHWGGRENIFRFCPHSDGVFAALSLNNEAEYGNSHLGAALHHDGAQTSYACWTYAELRMTPAINVIAQYSWAGGTVFCRHYGGVGLHAQIGEAEIGALTNLAWFTDQREWATEVSARIPASLFGHTAKSKAILGHFTIQPALHIIRIGRHTDCAALFRFSIDI